MDSSDTDDTTDFPMLDRLAFDCTRLAADLTTVAADRAAGDRLLATYIARADQLDAPIDDFDDDLDWFNVTEPLSLSADAAASAANNDADDDDARHSSPANTSAGTSASLRGKIVILDFFTYCCINCLHVLPDLRRIERLHTVPAGLCVVGVHSAKFANERDSANILAAVQRHHIGHPVVNDATGAMWQRLAVHCWPTLLVLGPRANPLFVLMGEGNYEALERYVGAALAFYGGTAQSGGGAAAALSAHSLPLDPAIDLIVSGGLVLRFPAKIASTASAPQPDGIDADDAAAELFAIVDTGHNRVLVADASGRILHRIGGRKAGFVDGDFRAVRFNGPQGACFRYEPAADGRPAQQPRWLLYVADTENHALRCCDLRRQTVETVAGTGVQGNDRLGGRCGREQALASPWDVAVCRMRQQDMSFHEEGRAVPEVDVVLIACAGTHQIWALFVEETIWWRFRRYAAGAVVAIVGNGNEENRNNSYPANAAFAQPSGLAWRADAKEVFVADSESSSVRRVQLADGKVTAVAGGDRNPLVSVLIYGCFYSRDITLKLSFIHLPESLCVRRRRRQRLRCEAAASAGRCVRSAGAGLLRGRHVQPSHQAHRLHDRPMRWPNVQRRCGEQHQQQQWQQSGKQWQRRGARTARAGRSVLQPGRSTSVCGRYQQSSHRARRAEHRSRCRVAVALRWRCCCSGNGHGWRWKRSTKSSGRSLRAHDPDHANVAIDGGFVVGGLHDEPPLELGVSVRCHRRRR